MKKRIEDGKPTQAVTLFVPVGVAEGFIKDSVPPLWRHKGRVEVIAAVHC